MFVRQPKRPWSGFGYLILIILAIWAAIFVVWPLGSQVTNVFQILTNALGGH